MPDWAIPVVVIGPYFLVSLIVIGLTGYVRRTEGYDDNLIFNGAMIALFWPVLIVGLVILTPYFLVYRLAAGPNKNGR